jgi:hypothetical protein
VAFQQFASIGNNITIQIVAGQAAKVSLTAPASVLSAGPQISCRTASVCYPCCWAAR